MTVYTLRDNADPMASILDKARSEGEVHIKSYDGSMYVVKPEIRRSPLDVQGVDVHVSRNEIVAIIRESRER